MYNIGFDLGSSSIKGSIVDSHSGKEILTLSEPKGEMDIISSKTDWAEQDPNKWWEYLCNLTKRLITESRIDSAKISAVGTFAILNPKKAQASSTPPDPGDGWWD